MAFRFEQFEAWKRAVEVADAMFDVADLYLDDLTKPRL